MARKSISKKLRFEVFKRDGFVCQYCGAHPPDTILHCDHIIAVAKGGDNDIDNLVTSCDRCNLGKGARSLKSIPKSLSEKADEIQEREDQIREYASIIKAQKDRKDNEAWDIAAILGTSVRENGYSKEGFYSIKRFIDRLGLEGTTHAAESAVARGLPDDYATFKYFCGICWSMIREKEQGLA